AVLGQILMEIVFLAYRSSVLVDAIARTLARLFVSRRKLLEWETAASTEQRLGTDLAHFVKQIRSGVILAAAIALLVIAVNPGALIVALPFLCVWLVSPSAAYFLSRPGAVARTVLTEAERRALQRVARKTWLFFETFVGDADHWLPPDNYQEIPDGRVAHRPSPTNEGLLLLSTLSANDLGYIGPRRMVERLEKTFETLNRLEKHWGHFYNWYQTETLQPLTPKYISTVDSGNLLGCLITLAHGLREKAEAPLVGPAVIQGLGDTLGLAAESPTVPKEPARRLAAMLESRPRNLADWGGWLETFEREARALAGRSPVPAGEGAGAAPPAATWADRLVEQVVEWRAELDAAAPWRDEISRLVGRDGPRLGS